MPTFTIPCEDCGRPVEVPDNWPVDWAYCYRPPCASADPGHDYDPCQAAGVHVCSPDAQCDFPNPDNKDRP